MQLGMQRADSIWMNSRKLSNKAQNKKAPTISSIVGVEFYL